MDKIIFLTILSIAAGGVLQSGDHHGDGHDEQCIDISRYLPLQYNESSLEFCSYKVEKTCTKQSEEVCVTVPGSDCEIIEYTECENIPRDHQVRDDSIQNKQFLQQRCISTEKKLMSEMKKIPVCKKVSKQQCDSKWEVNEQGEKVWVGNSNCKEVSWEDCSLEEKIVTEEVDVWECTPDTEPTVYQVADMNTVDVTTSDRVCQPRANPVCSQTTKVSCQTVEWEDCYDSVIPHCNRFNVRVPYQEYDHRLRCADSTRISPSTAITKKEEKSATTAPITTETTTKIIKQKSTTTAPITTKTTATDNGLLSETQECDNSEVEVAEEVCREEEACEKKKSMQCETMECSKESGLVCKKKKSCRKLWQSVCDDDGCTNGNVIVCEETDAVVCEQVLNTGCSEYPKEECKQVDTMECQPKTVCTTETRMVKMLC